jgi:hypothetical protein
LIAHGHTNVEVAELLVISPKTVCNHVSNIFQQAAGSQPGAGRHPRDAGQG